MLLLIIVAHALPVNFWNRLGDMFVRSPWPVKLLIFLVVVQCVVELQEQDVSPFIYFQF